MSGDTIAICRSFSYDPAGQQLRPVPGTYPECALSWSVLPINLIVLLLLVHVVYIGIRCYVKDWREERGYY